MENQSTADKNRLTKKQSITLMIASIIIWIVAKAFIGDGTVSTTINAITTLAFIYSLISLFTKNGLRWK